jgi:alkylation response protein AidB-like acyl-CoA dehydrogenase
MDFDYSDEQQLLRDSVARFVREEYAFDARKRLIASGQAFSASHWSLFAELGWLAVPLPESCGGLDGSAVDNAIILEEFGRGLVLEPWVPTLTLGAGAIAALGSPAQQQALLARVVAGELQLALAHFESAARYDATAIATRALRHADHWQLDGGKCVVLNAPAADLLLVSAREPSGGVAVFLVEPGTPGLRMLPYRNIDGTMAAELVLEGLRLPVDARLGDQPDALPALGILHDRAALLACAEAVGAMAVLLQKTVEYTRTRRQFGVAIGSFQALQHRMADMFIEVEQSRSILMMALLTADSSGDIPRAVSAAKSRIGRAARKVGQEAVQLHGGIGVTEDLDVGHYVKRLIAIEALFGNSDWHLRRFGSAGHAA